jgi:hypothetical protein
MGGGGARPDGTAIVTMHLINHARAAKVVPQRIRHDAAPLNTI